MTKLGVFPPDCLEDSQKKLEKLIDDNKSELETLLAQPIKTYKNFVRPYMDAGARLNSFFIPIYHLNSVKNDEKSQEAFVSCIPIVSAYSTEMQHDKRVYDVFVQIKNNEYNTLNDECREVLEKAIFDFELEGVNLPQKQKERLKEINIRDGELSEQFSQNLLDATNSYKIVITDETELGEMPDSDKSMAKISNGWEFTLQMPSYIAFMTYVTNRTKREEVYKAYSTRSPENGDILEEILALRMEKANILGFENFSKLRLQNMSAPSVEAVLEFLDKLGKSGKPYAIKELAELNKLAAADGISAVQAFDIAYYSEKLKKVELDYDEEKLRPYFEQSGVVNAIFRFFETFLGIKFTQMPAELWNDKVKFYEVSAKNGIAGGLYLDLEARPEKQGGAWMCGWHTRHKDRNDVVNLPEVFVVANFPPSTPDTPSLLRHDDVHTLFHEMGHALHQLMSLTDEYSVSGTNGVAWDVVEFPSQFFENFAYAPEVLDVFRLPKDLQEKVVNAKNFLAGLDLVRQLEFSIFDMLIHMEKVTQADVQKKLDDVRGQVSVVIPPEYNKFQHGFSHIFAGGYAAGYYSYKWAEMLSASSYFKFTDVNIDKKVAEKFLHTVLSTGATYKMDEVYKKFFGENPDPEAILRQLALRVPAHGCNEIGVVLTRS